MTCEETSRLLLVTLLMERNSKEALTKTNIAEVQSTYVLGLFVHSKIYSLLNARMSKFPAALVGLCFSYVLHSCVERSVELQVTNVRFMSFAKNIDGVGSAHKLMPEAKYGYLHVSLL